GDAALRGLLFPDLSWTDPEAATRLFGFVAVAALVAGAATGAVPALQAASPDVLQALKGGGRGVSERAARARNVLIAFQAGLSVLLLIGAGLFVRSLVEVRDLDLGLAVDDLLVVEPAFDAAFEDEARRRFYLRVSETLEAVPGVRGATAAVATPFMNSYSTGVEAEGVDSIPDVGTGGPYIYGVQPDFFDVLGQRVLRGRAFATADARADAARVAIVNASMARRVWPGKDPLGRCLFIGDDVDERRCTTVVGVVGDARREDLIESETLAYYVPFPSAHMNSWPPDALIVSTALEPGDVVDDVRRALHAAEPALRFARIRPMRELLAPEARAWTLGATMFSVFGLLALLVAGIGLYSVLAFAVAQRRREIGIRAALGAAPARIVRMVIGQALRVAGLGITIGLLIALAAAPRLGDLLYRVSPRDPVVFAGVALTLLVVAALAGTLPAFRATRVDPQEALRSE
ncbi:MAG: FtsX-like permease family protein, partial [Longimicrobiales bacterium]